MNFHKLVAVPALFLVWILAGILLVCGFCAAMVVIVPIGLTILTAEAAWDFVKGMGRPKRLEKSGLYMGVDMARKPYHEVSYRTIAVHVPKSLELPMPDWRRECGEWVERNGF